MIPFSSFVLGGTAAITSDEFYAQARTAHQITSLAVHGAIEMVVITASVHYNTGILAAIVPTMLIGTSLLYSTILVPTITDQIHEYTHPHLNNSLNYGKYYSPQDEKFVINLDSFYKINPHLEQNIRPMGLDQDFDSTI